MNNYIMDCLQNNKFLLIAEIGVNYYDVAEKLNISLMQAAKFMVLSARNAGIKTVKFQSYKAESLAIKNSPAYWDLREECTESQFALFKKYDAFGESDYLEIKEFCDHIGIEFCSTPFDFSAVDYLDRLMNVYKISSSDLNNIPFIEYVAKKQKPILLSTGASNEDEIRQAVKTIEKYNKHRITLLHCVLEYPTPYPDANLAKIKALKENFPQCCIGYSDHTRPDDSFDVIKTAFLLGAQLVEKHFTVDKKLTGNDHYHAMDPHDAEEILAGIHHLQLLMGDNKLISLETEAAARLNARRSLVAVCPIKKGSVINRSMLTFKRPGTGISPADINLVLGKIAFVDIEEDTVITKEMLI